MASQQVIPFDISRGRRNEQSKAAFAKVEPHRPSMRLRVLTAIAAAGEVGLTLKQLAQVFEKPVHALSGRLSELRALELITPVQVLDGFAVYVITEKGKRFAEVAK